MPQAKFLTHADRAQRRGTIKARLRNGERPSEIAKDYGLTRRYVCQIAQDAGLSSAKGRPRGSRWWADCPEHLIEDYDYLTRRMRIPVAEIKAMLERAA